jgi:NAD(P)-dependent dehydrogenase (short-subunit alcohol dehydrogenase family)
MPRRFVPQPEEMQMAEPVCVISGVGPGTGSALVRRFAAGGYRIAMLARSAERLADLADQVPSAKAYVCRVSDQSQVDGTMALVEHEMGAPSVLIHNAVAGAWDGMHLIYEALKRTAGSPDGDAVLAAMKGMAWESPRGPMSIDPQTRDVNKWRGNDYAAVIVGLLFVIAILFRFASMTW